MRKRGLPALFPAGLILTLISLAPLALAAGPQAVSPYQLSVFATAPAGFSAPDSIAVFDNKIRSASPTATT
jgi:hypothetical protein